MPRLPTTRIRDAAPRSRKQRERSSVPHCAIPDPADVRCAAVPEGDHLIGIADIRKLCHLGRTAAYELVNRPGFPSVVPVSRRTHRWWANEVVAFLAALQETGQQPVRRPRSPRSSQEQPRRIAGSVRYTRSRRNPASGSPADAGRTTS
jgi:predicted DNA-binding transcriptional regulator AlpA